MNNKIVAAILTALVLAYGGYEWHEEINDIIYPGAPGDAWCNNDYAKRIDINVNNTGGSALTDYQVYVNLTSNHINETSIRVYNATSCTLRSHWTENETGGNSYGVWVNYSAIAASAWTNNTAIYYENATASSTSSIEDTFIIGNDGTSLDFGEDGFTLKDTLSPSYPNDFDVYDNGNRTIIAEYSGNKVSLYNSVDKTNLVLLDSIAVTNAHDVRVIDGDNDWAYYVNYNSNTFGILNLTNENSITIEDTITCTNANYCRAYNISGNLTVFVVTYLNNGLNIYNVTDHSITLLDSITGSGANYDIREAWRVMYHPEYKLAIVGSKPPGTGATSVFDVSNLSNIIPKAKYTSASWEWPSLFIEGNKLYGCYGAADTIGVATINSNGTLTLLGDYTSSTYLDVIHAIYVENDFIYTASWGNDNIAVWDATDPTNITYVTSISTSILDSRHAIEKNGSYIWTAGAYSPGLFTVHEYNASAVVASEWTVVEPFTGSTNWGALGGVINATPTGDSASFLYSNVQMGTNNYAIEVNILSEAGLTGSNYVQGLRFDVSQSNAYRGLFRWCDYSLYDYWNIIGASAGSNSAVDASFDARNWHEYEFIKNGSSWHGYVDNDLKVSRTETWNAQYVGMTIYYGTDGKWTNFDDFRVRKYSYPEPSTTLGSEEQQAGGTTPVISNVQNGSISSTSQWIDWDVNQTAHNRVVYDKGYVGADSTACDGQWSATHACANASDGNWSSYAESAGALTSYAYFNYTVPTGASQPESLWHVKDAVGHANLTIPAACWGATLYLRAMGSDIGNSMTWQCDNGPGWTTLRSSVANIAYEEEMKFKYTSSWDNSTATPNITLSGLTASTLYEYQAWSYNTINISLSDNSTTLNFTTASGTPIIAKQWIDVDSYNNTHVIYNLTSWIYNNHTSALNVSVDVDANWTDYNINTLASSASDIHTQSATFVRPLSDANFTAAAAILGDEAAGSSNALVVFLPVDPPSKGAGANDITILAGKRALFCNWSEDQTFQQMQTNLTNTTDYFWYNSTSQKWIFYNVSRAINQDTLIDKHSAIMVCFNKTTTVSCNILSAETITIPSNAWYYTALRESTSKTLTEINTAITADGCTVTDSYAWNSPAGAYTNTGSYSVLPNEGFAIYATTGCPWDGSI